MIDVLFQIPTKNSAYVNQVLRPVEQFVQAHGGVVDETQKTQWLTEVLDNATQR